VIDAAALTGSSTPMMITPRDIDLLVGRAGKTLSLAINKALQPQLSLEEIAYLVG
jgi:spore protease